MDIHSDGPNLDEASRIAKLTELGERLKNGEQLSVEDKYYMLDNATEDWLLTQRGEDAENEFFTRFFTYLHAPEEDRIKWDSMVSIWKPRHLTYYNIMLQAWIKDINKKNENPLLTLVAKETKLELENHRKANSITSGRYNPTIIRKERMSIFAWSKYRYTTIKRLLNKSFGITGHHKMILGSEEIIYNYESLVHILSRHYGEIMKFNSSERDHFHGDFEFTDLHLRLENIFALIGPFLASVSKPNSVTFRSSGTIYRVYIVTETVNKKGVPNYKIRRVSTFFPVGNAQMLQEIHDFYEEKQVNASLSVFVPK